MAILETGLLGARWKLNANNHRKAHVPFGGLFFVTWIRCRFSFGSEEDDGCSRANFDELGAHDAVFRVGLLCIAN
jgi:hypothetical protein